MHRAPAEPIDTIPKIFFRTVGGRSDHAALWIRREGAYRPITWRELALRVRKLAAALTRAGVRAGDRVAQVSENRDAWIVSDLAIQTSRAVHVPIHPTLSGPQIAYQIAHSGAKVAFLAGPSQADALRDHAAELTAAQFVTYDTEAGSGDDAILGIRLTDFTQGCSDQDLDDANTWQKGMAEDLATILYTSGTTGEPKGVMLSQSNLTSNTRATCAVAGGEPDDLRLCFLPLSHIYARTCDLYTWICQGSQLALAESRETVVANAQEIHPTLLNGVPYFYDKVARALRAASGDIKPGALRDLLGGRIRVCFSGGAALPDDVAKTFHEQGIPLLQGYGLTESSPVISFTTMELQKIGTVGRPIPGVEVRLGADGEILTRGPHVMMGYWKDDAATAAAIRDGWLHTGDLGMIDDQGCLSITGRKKELIVTATGKNIAPTLLEGLLTASPLISQAMVLGDGRNFLTALVVPDLDALRDEVARRRMDAAEPLLGDTRVPQLYREEIDRLLSGLARHEQIGRFALLDRPFSIQGGELTAKLSLRRDVIQSRFAAEIEALYAHERHL
jgi:long-chain acyl-CoA synthetase